MSLRTSLVIAGLLATLTGALPTPCRAGFLGGLRLLPEYRTWSASVDSVETETTVSQIYVPAIATLRFAPTVEMVVAGGFGQSEVEIEDGEGFTATGPSDVTAQLFVRLLDNRLLLQGGAQLPSGLRELDSEELTVVSALSSPLLAFPMKSFGQGLGLTGGAAVAIPLGPRAAFGLGAGYIQTGEYVLVEDGGDYNPGDEFSVSAGIDLGGRPEGGAIELGRAPIRIDAVYRSFGKDESDDVEIFQEGAQLEAQALLQTTGSPLHLWVLGRIVQKSDNKILLAGEGDTVEELEVKAGLFTTARGGLDFPLGGRSRLGVEGEWAQFGDTDDGALEGSSIGVGPTLRLGLGPDGVLRLGARILRGEFDTDPTIDLEGIAGNVALVWRPRS